MELGLSNERDISMLSRDLLNVLVNSEHVCRYLGSQDAFSSLIPVVTEGMKSKNQGNTRSFHSF